MWMHNFIPTKYGGSEMLLLNRQNERPCRQETAGWLTGNFDFKKQTEEGTII